MIENYATHYFNLVMNKDHIINGIRAKGYQNPTDSLQIRGENKKIQ